MAVLATHHSLRHDWLHILRDHADIGLVAAVVAKAIVAQAVSEMAEKNDIVLQRNIGPSPAATTAASAATTAATAAPRAATTAAHSRATTTAAVSAEACVSTRGLRVCYFAGLDIPKGIAAARLLPCTGLLSATATCARLLPCTGLLGATAPCARLLPCTGLLSATATCARLLPCTGLLGAAAPCARFLSCIGLLGATAWTRAAGASTIAKVRLSAARFEHLLTASAPKIHPVLTSATNVVIRQTSAARSRCCI